MKSLNLIILFTLSLLYFLSSCATRPYSKASDDDPMPDKPGACYAKCNSPTFDHKQEDYLLVYTGEEPNQYGVTKRKIKVRESTTKWVKRKSDRNCLSADPDDCLVWCLVETPADTRDYFIVTDTTLIKDFKIEYLEGEVRPEISHSASDDDPMPDKPGACYAKCNSPTFDHKQEDYLLVYTGEEPNQYGVTKRKIKVRESTTKWVKRKSDRNCLSADPDDCLVWCLVETPAATKDYFIVTDTTLIKDFKIEYLEAEVPPEISHSEWQEVVCDSLIHKTLILNIEELLSQKHYLNSDYEGSETEINSQLYNGMTEYQKDNALYTGCITIEFLEHIGIY